MTSISAGNLIYRNGEVIPPRIQSYLFWRDIFSGKVPDYNWIATLMKANGYSFGDSYDAYMTAHDGIYHLDHCGFCGSAGTRADKYGYYHCLCSLLRETRPLSEQCYEWGSTWAKKSVDTIQIITDTTHPNGAKDLKAAVDRTRRWIDQPDKWLVYTGNPGVGKTHLMNAIVAAWFPYAMYVVASDFEDRLRKYLSEEKNKIQKYIDALMYHPILVFDDLGLEHSTEWIQAKIDAIIEYRSRDAHWWDYHTVIGTNIPQSKLKTTLVRQGVSRSGSRLTDFAIVDWITIRGADMRNRSVR